MSVLAHQRVRAEGASPRQWLLILHGILGRGENWRSFARKLTEARPDWGAILVDLRMHGDSQPLPGPHTLAAATQDVRHLFAETEGAAAVAGHSFGGKVALGLLADRDPRLRSLWVLDATPSARPARSETDTTLQVIGALRGLPETFPDRRAFVAALGQRGVGQALAMWLAKNLISGPEGLRLRLDLDAIDSLMGDFDRQDYWPLLQAPPSDVALHVVLAGRTHVLEQSERARIAQLAQAGALQLHELPDAGHWLHVDDPQGLLRILANALS